MPDPIMDGLEVETEDQDKNLPVVEIETEGGPAKPSAEDELAPLRAEIDRKNAEVAERDRQLADYAARTERAEYERNTAIQQRFGAQDAAVANALVSATNEAKQYKAEYQRALEEGKFDVASDINDKLLDARLRIKTAESQRQWLDGQKHQFAQQIEADAQTRERMEQQAQQQPAGPSAKAKAWIDAHPQFNTDDAYRYRALAAHAEAVKQGLEIDSNDYFDHLNAAVDGEQRTVTSERPAPAPKPSRATTAPGPSRSGGNGGSGGNRRVVSLSAQQKEWADIAMPNLAPEERYKRYARNIEVMARRDREAGMPA